MEDSKLKLKHKIILDSVHGVIPLSNIACQIIDTHIFQRLRYIAQLGLCQYIWPTANHTRFSHSLGVYHITGIMLDAIKENSDEKHIKECLKKNPYLENNNNGLTDRICELIKIGGLCHDLGHGPFSHAFDELVLDVSTSPLKRHEYRSQILFEKIIKEQKINMSEKEIKFIQYIIDPDEKVDIGFEFEIVSNKKNGIDVDKFDYICRDAASINQHFGFNWSVLCKNVKVIDNTICYKTQFATCINSMFNARYELHKQIYHHPKLLSIDFMMLDIIKLIDEKYNIKNSIFDDSF